MIDANDGGVDVSTRRRRDLVRAAAADLAVLPRRRRQLGAVPRRRARCRTSAPPRGRATASRSAGIALGDWHSVGGGEAGFAVPDPADPNIVYAGEYGGILTRYDHRTRQARNVSAWPDNPSGHGGEDLTLPLPVDRADRDLAARPEGRLPRRQRALPHHATAARPGTSISPRPDAQRQVEAEVVRRPDHRRQHRRRVLLHDLRDRRVAAARRACSGPAATTASSTSRRDGGKTWTNVTASDARACPSGAR